MSSPSYLPLSASSSSSSSRSSPPPRLPSRSSCLSGPPSKKLKRIALSSFALLLVIVCVVVYIVRTIRAVSFWHRPNLARLYLPSWAADITYPLAPPAYFLDDYHEITRADNPPLASYTCPSLHGGRVVSEFKTDEEMREAVVNPLVMVATFSVANNFDARAMLREHRRVGLLPKDDRLLETVFVLGALRTDGTDGNVTERAQTEVRLEEEQARHGDLMRLGMEENMDEGKTYEFMKHVVQRAESTGPSPQFVIKTDEDTILNLPNLLSSLATFDCSKGIYWGTTVGSCLNGCFPRYFQGMAYGLSYPLLAHLVHSNIEHGHARGTEDARTGSWMGAVDERTRREKEGKGEIVQWAEVGQLLGGDEWWFAKSPDWIGKHPYKTIDGWLARWSAEQTLWATLGRPYVWMGGDEVARRP